MHVKKPGIRTAIPLRRYRLGEFQITILGDIESSDGHAYRYIMAVIHGENPEPGMYLTVEPPADGGGKLLEMRLIMLDGEETIGRDAGWQQLDSFAERGIQVVSRVLGLTDEVPWQMQ